MNPAVAEVILVHESLQPAQLQIAQSHARCIDAHHAGTLAIDCVFAAPNLKAVQMHILPTKGDLQYLVQLRHRAVATYE